MRCVFFFQAEDGIRDLTVTGVQTCALPISRSSKAPRNISPLIPEWQSRYAINSCIDEYYNSFQFHRCEKELSITLLPLRAVGYSSSPRLDCDPTAPLESQQTFMH